jgi:hypothetical protein
MTEDKWAQRMADDDAEDETTFWRNIRESAGTNRHNQADRAEWFTVTRADANRVPCRYCKRAPGEPCVIIAKPFGLEVIPLTVLKKFPAHVQRINDARKATQ